MKPLLERKRRARINGCLDELKELMEYLGADGQRMQRLEKADVLEVTVKHLRHLKAQGLLNTNENLGNNAVFGNGYRDCATEVASFICNPYSGVSQVQAASVVGVLQDGLMKCSSGRPVEPSHLVPKVENIKMESDTDSIVDTSDTALDLSKK